MKKKFKMLLFLTGAVAMSAAVNHLIFKYAGFNDKKDDRVLTYKWRHGKIRYIAEGRGEPLVLVHGIGAGESYFEWEKNIAELSKHYRVYALDLLGFGKSDKPDISYSAYLYVTLINDFVRDAIGRKANIIASSTSAAYVALAYHFDKSLYNKMLLISPTGVGACNEMPSANDLWLKWIMSTPILGTSIYNLICSKYYIRWFLKENCYADHRKVTDKVVSRYSQSAHAGGVGAKLPIASFVSNFLNVNIEHVLSKILCPIHIVWGEDNEMNSICNFQTIEKLNPNVELTIFEGAKFLPHVEDPKAFHEVCVSFFG